VEEIKVEPTSDKKPKPSFKDKFEFDTLEKEIPLLEREKEALSAKMNEPNISHVDLQKASERYGQVIALLDEKSLRWLELSELVG
jgi:ABC transport system ATP-binding/permease protein